MGRGRFPHGPSVASTVGTLVLLAGAPASAAASPFKTFYPVGLPVQLELPDTWIANRLVPGVAFIASDPTSSPNEALTANVNIVVQPYGNTSFSSFAAVAIQTMRQQDKTADPKATERWRKITLPAGRAVQWIHRLRQSVGGRVVLFAGVVYAFQHGNRSYSISYAVPATKFRTYLPIFERSARTIRFKPH